MEKANGQASRVGEWFQTIWKYFITDGGLPGWDGSWCCYRTPNGGRCAVGAILPDNAPSEVLECKGGYTSGPIHDYLLYTAHEGCFLRDVQLLHDLTCENGWDVDVFRTKLEALAERYGLTV